MGRKLNEIAKNHQVICITHLPQIAACADANYRIYKETDDTSTYTYIEMLDGNSSVDEIARLRCRVGEGEFAEMENANVIKVETAMLARTFCVGLRPGFRWNQGVS